MSNVPKSEKKHIVFTGRRNAGKSSLVNRFTGQELVIVSDTPGTTTDPVRKAMELHPFGPCVIVDTAGIDDSGELGAKRISKTEKEISVADFVVVVIDAAQTLSRYEEELFARLKKLGIPFIAAVNKTDLGINPELIEQLKERGISFSTLSCLEDEGIYTFKEKVARLIPPEEEITFIGDLVQQHDVIVLVVPIDLGAPKGRLIMPQVKTIREALDEDTMVVVTKDKELRAALDNLKYPPKLVVTDSQAVMRVNADVPPGIQMTTFSILMARYKGELTHFTEGLNRVEELQNGDKVLIAESCTHHAQEDDIGKIKIPRWLRLHTGKNLEIDIKSGADFPEDLAEYKLVIHCGGCMLTRKAMQARIKLAKMAGVPIVNYGVLISYLHGAVPRALEPFGEALAVWEKSDMAKFSIR